MSLKNFKELNRKSVSIQNTPEFLGQSAQYKLEKVIQTYSTDLAQSYTVVQTIASRKNFDLYGSIVKKPEIIDLSRFISFVNFTHNKNILPIIDFGITTIDGSEVFGMICQYLPEEKLIANNLNLFIDSTEIALQKVIIPILELLVQLHNTEITHGCINHNNIWVEVVNDEIEEVLLSNTALEIPGYSQIPNYEPLNRMLVHKAGKEISKQADCYAVGILLASLISGKIFSKSGYEKIIASKAKVGSYKTIIQELFDDDESYLAKATKYVLYWLLHDDESKRWTAQQALKFLRRRHRKLTLDNTEKITKEDESSRKLLFRPLQFSGEECCSMTSAAVSAIKHYEEIKLKVKNGKLIKELLDNPDIHSSFIKKVSDLRLLNGFEKEDSISHEELFLTLFIVLLDNQMPIKLRDVAFQPRAFWQMTKYILNNQFISIASTWSKILNQREGIYFNISTYCGINIDKIYQIPSLGKISNESSFMSGYIDKNTPYIIKDIICFSVGDIVDLLNSFDEAEIVEVLHNRSFIGFIIGKLYSEEIKISENSLIDIVEDDFALFFFAISLYCEYNKNYPKKLAIFIKNVLIDKYVCQIKSAFLKSSIISKLETAASTGDVSQMYKIITRKKIDKKQEKYKDIVQEVNRLKNLIQDYDSALNDNKKLMEDSRTKTIKFAGSVLIITLLFIFYKLF